MAQPIQDAIQQGVAAGAQGAAETALSVLDKNFWTLTGLMLLGALASTCLVAVIRRRFKTSKATNEVMGYAGALGWAAAIEVAYMREALGVESWTPLAAVGLTAGIIASAVHRFVYRVALLLWLTLRWTLARFAVSKGVPEEQVAEALGETMTKMGWRKNNKEGG